MFSIIDRIKKKFKPMVCHCEAIVDDSVWAKIQESVKQNKVHTWYVTTPYNLAYTNGLLNSKYTEEQLSEIMKTRYKWLIENNQRVQLHVHLSATLNMTFDKQNELIVDSLNWFKRDLGIHPTEIVFGWWQYNLFSEMISKSLGLKIINFADYNSFHDYDMVIRGNVK
jgi:hypothetical protein